MSRSPVSATLTVNDKEVLLQAITTIKEKLPFLIDLSNEERKALPKMGDKSRAFVSKALEIATQNPEFLPRSFDLEEMRKDVQLYEALYPLLLALSQLQELVDDTSLAVGSEAYAAALQVYSYAKASGQTGGLDTVVEEMGQRFARKSRKAKPQAAAL
ncbi:hypothetical protein H6G76_32780 [Nostoc sp. FACHB-152]|uniref:hypothetical protein n=1 Tax=unclassified Nostoc TaxID=2593658 RepID=UPI001686FEB1|nr:MULTISPECIES: hypothetical protein [unclassified Nostoc]MBD2451813.1 hypothetical protein [Nostoc sp. FACHB-152]MBD2472897.1 hypothetical protein [Nostoc sp. FACHB-145]